MLISFLVGTFGRLVTTSFVYAVTMLCFTLAFDGDFDSVVVAMAIGIVALPENFQIFSRTQLESKLSTSLVLRLRKYKLEFVTI